VRRTFDITKNYDFKSLNFIEIINIFHVTIVPMATKQTLQRKAKKHARVHGFLKRMMDHDGRNVLKRRRTKGRKKITA
jgi:large subunit ribosomal protein L34